MVDPQARSEALVGRLRKQVPVDTAAHCPAAPPGRQRGASQRLPPVRPAPGPIPDYQPGDIYKTLNLLKDLDEVLELGFSDDDNRYDGNKPYPHPHLFCVRCRKIVDPEVSIAQDPVRQVAQQSGYQIMSRRLDFYGLCPDCRKGE
jgi:hypothetical protein